MLPAGTAGSLPCPDFDLKGTLLSGQVFRWRPANGGFSGWIGSRPIRVSQQGDRLLSAGAPADEVRWFFSLDVDLSALARRVDVDPVIHEALQAHWGLRVIRQEPWECLASFILSAFNNIPRLTGMLDRLAERYGGPAERGRAPLGVKGARPARPLCRFPRAEALARLPERMLRAMGMGYRAPLLRAAAREAASGRADLEQWRLLEDGALRERLLALPGVGEKVAECVMLFGYGRAGAFPVDVWIGRAMRAWYFRGRKVTDRKIREFARRRFGPECGWAQQYLYCRARRGFASSGRSRPR